MTTIRPRRSSLISPILQSARVAIKLLVVLVWPQDCQFAITKVVKTCIRPRALRQSLFRSNIFWKPPIFIIYIKNQIQEFLFFDFLGGPSQSSYMTICDRPTTNYFLTHLAVWVVRTTSICDPAYDLCEILWSSCNWTVGILLYPRPLPQKLTFVWCFSPGWREGWLWERWFNLKYCSPILQI